MKPFFLLLTALIVTSSAFCQSLPAKLDTILSAYFKQNAFNGSALVAQKGTILLEKGYGYKDIQAKSAVDSNTIFQIGSITKQFTSAIILQLQEQRKLSLQDKLTKYIPDYPRQPDLPFQKSEAGFPAR